MSESPSYADLAEFLASYANIVGGVDDISIISELAGEVKVAAVQSLLLARAPDVLDTDNPERFVLFLEALNGIATEVEAIVGIDPQEPVRKLAVWAITVGIAASIEASLFPEQQVGGDDGAASALQIRYLSLLKQLRGLPGVEANSGPSGSFPPAARYPDPAEPCVATLRYW